MSEARLETGIEPAAAVNGAEPAPRALRTAGIASIAAAVPARAVPNSEIAGPLGIDDDWIASRTGIRERRIAGEGETLVGLSSAAAAEALERAGIEPTEIDLVIVATFTPDDLQPHAAPLVAREIGATRAGATDVGAACSGFLYGLSLASAQVESGRADAVVVVGADFATRVTDFTDKRTAGLFGDGTGAAVVTAGGPGSIGPLLLRADAGGAHFITATHEERKLRMDGRQTFRAAVAAMSEVTLEVAEAAGVALDEIDLFVYHQANGRILSAVGERLDLPADRVVDCIERYGNTSAATVPIALTEAAADGRLAPGTTVLLGAFGAGFTWAGAIIEWGGVA
ncbi:MAG TPA: beta-ketoacyl-ACP synthase 3 [Solirubrobacterales bacterium]|nr:beta-ketoacyl-ACP synthase 3 [Solirubrobacterales bacterium]